MTAETAARIDSLVRRLAVAQRQCDDATALLNAERLRSADLRAALRAIADLEDEAHGSEGVFAAAVRIAGDALDEGRPRG